MRAILIDDEPLALNYLAEELERLSEIEIIGKFRSPVQALEEIILQRPDVIFTDIEMPEMNGIELAERILQQLPDTQLVFVTVYDEYAVKAFELNSLDYVLKPLETERLAKTISRLESTNVNAVSSTISALFPNESLTKSLTTIHCFGFLQFGRVDIPRTTLRWKTSKAQELFSYLLHYRGKPVRKQVLLDELWPGIEWKRAITQLYTAIYQIRKLLQGEQINIQISNLEEGYMLELNGAVMDIEVWEEEMSAAPLLTLDTLTVHLQIASLYRGDYLGEYAYLWAEIERRRLRNLWIRHQRQIADYYISLHRYEDAADRYLKVQEILPDEESIYMDLMYLYDTMGDLRSVEYQYNLLTAKLLKDLDTSPHPTIQKWFADWKFKVSNNSIDDFENK